MAYRSDSGGAQTVPKPDSGVAASTASTVKAVDSISRHWLALVNLMVGVWVVLPWLAPALMSVGAEPPARLIYWLYGFQCHQLPQRSYFLFGSALMHPISDIQAVWPISDPLLLRDFVGTAQMGWKVAWSDRMVSLYTPLFLGGLLYAVAGRQWRPLALRSWLLLAVPLALDGVTHLVNDVLRLGWRDGNDWLAALTAHSLPAWFYSGDALGSFNWWMRLLTGLLLGFATVWVLHPRIDRLRSPGSRGSVVSSAQRPGSDGIASGARSDDSPAAPVSRTPS